MARILVIDDDQRIREFLARLLGREGHDVVVAGDGIRGAQCCRDIRPALAFVDIIMPEQDGLDTIREIRRDCPDTRVIAISGGGATGNTGNLDHATEFGAHRALEKPFDLDELLEAVRTCLGEDADS